MYEHGRLFPLLLQPAPHPGPQPAALREQHQRCGSVGGPWGGGAAGGADLGWGAHMPPRPVPPEDLPDHDIHTDICWKKVTNYVCSHPLHGRHTTYTECCCQDGEAWSQQCALCPPRSSGEKGGLCLKEGRGDTCGAELGPRVGDVLTLESTAIQVCGFKME